MLAGHISMFIVESTIHLAAPLARVWRLLIDLEHYSDWHPTLALKGIASVGTEIGYKFKTGMRSFPEVSTTADVTRVDRHAAFFWKLGMKGLLEVEQGFELAKSDSGTIVTHKMCCRGVLSVLAVPSLKRGFEKTTVATNQFLARFLKRGTTTARYSQQTKRHH